MRVCVIVLLALAVHAVARAQEDTTFAVLASLGLGFGVNISDASLLPKRADNRGPAATLRALWKPDHRLRVGLETGWMRLTRSEGVLTMASGQREARALMLDAVPVLGVFSMNFDRFSVNAGAGYYLMVSYLLGGGDGVTSTQWNYGISGHVEYLIPIGGRLELGVSAGVYGITQLGQYMGALHARAQYRLFEY